jgi:hypothetical protein
MYTSFKEQDHVMKCFLAVMPKKVKEPVPEPEQVKVSLPEKIINLARSLKQGRNR